MNGLPDDVAVTEADREAAWPFAGCAGTAADIGAGKSDWLPLVQAFARHRLAAISEDAFRARVHELVAESCGSAAALARKHGVHPKALTLFLSGARGPSAEVAAAFGYQRRYVPIDLLDGGQQ